MNAKIAALVAAALGGGGADAPVEVSVPDEPEVQGHFSTNAAMRVAKGRGMAPMALAEEIAEKVRAAAPAGFFEKVEAAAPGFVNFWASMDAWRAEYAAIAEAVRRGAAGGRMYGTNTAMEGRTVMVEFTDPNPFKLFHIGHLMSNTIGESFSRLYAATGAKVVCANYQGDVGLHVAKAVWGMERIGKVMPEANDGIGLKMAFLGEAYAYGARAYEDDLQSRGEIDVLNERIYAKDDANVNRLYATGRAWSLEYFETVYARLGTKFDRYYFESEMAAPGLDAVEEGLEKGIFAKSEGAIVFPGEEYGLHTRVFVNSRGLPTYEAKELALNRKKFEEYPLDLSVVVTGNEIVEYFKVLLRAMAQVLPPEVAARTRHMPHGMLRLPTGKMSSRTGDVVTAEDLFDQVKERLAEKVSARSALDDGERAMATETIAVGAIKYSILKQNPGQDIVFDFEKSLSFEGDAGPYLHYAYARLRSILRKADEAGLGKDVSMERGSMGTGTGNGTGTEGRADGVALLGNDAERALIRRLAEFPDAVARAAERLAPSVIAAYCYRLAVAANKFYETTPVLKDEDAVRRAARLGLAADAAEVLRTGLGLLGMGVLEKI